MNQNLKKFGPLLTIGIPTYEHRKYGGVSIEWACMQGNIQTPLGSQVAKKIVKGQLIDDARNEIVEYALKLNSDYVFFLGDDVHINSDALLKLLRHDVEIVTGLYFTKENPTSPYIWRGPGLKGPFLDWKAGEFFEIDFAGCDCLLVHTSVFKKLEKPWFSRNWVWEKDENGNIPKPFSLATEDFYFFAKAKQAGFKAWADANVLCKHEDRRTGMYFGLTVDMPQWTGKEELKSKDDGKLIAILGSDAVQMDIYSGNCVRFDIREETNPDIRCDIRQIPEPKEKYDVAYASHVLEHLDPLDVESAINEWVRILKVGGELRIRVPNIHKAFEKILNGTDTEYEWAMVYGRPQPFQHHLNGFNQRVLQKLLELNPCLEKISVTVDEDEYGLYATAIKKKDNNPAILSEMFETNYVLKDRE